MSELKIDFCFTQEVLNNANEVQNDVDQILGEIKNELLGSSDVGGSAVDLANPVAAGKNT